MAVNTQVIEHVSDQVRLPLSTDVQVCMCPTLERELKFPTCALHVQPLVLTS